MHSGAGCIGGACQATTSYCEAICASHGGVATATTDSIATTGCDAYCAKKAAVCPGFPCHRGVECLVEGGQSPSFMNAALQCLADKAVWDCSRGEVFIDDSTCVR